MNNYWPPVESGAGHSVKAREKPYDWADDEAALTEDERAAREKAWGERYAALADGEEETAFVNASAVAAAERWNADQEGGTLGEAGRGRNRPDGAEGEVETLGQVAPDRLTEISRPVSPSADPVFDIAVDGARNLWGDGLLAATVGMPEPVKEGGE